MIKRVRPYPIPPIPKSNGKPTHRRNPREPGALEPLRPLDWERYARQVAAERGNRCQITGLTTRDTYLRVPKDGELDRHGKPEVERMVSYRLQLCHLDHDPLNNDRGNLVLAIAQWHGSYDYYHHRGARMCVYAAQGRLTLGDKDATMQILTERFARPEFTPLEEQYDVTRRMRDYQRITPGELEFVTLLALDYLRIATPEELVCLVSRRLKEPMSATCGGGIMRALAHLQLRGLTEPVGNGIWRTTRKSVVMEPGIKERPEQPLIIPPGWTTTRRRQ